MNNTIILLLIIFLNLTLMSFSYSQNSKYSYILPKVKQNRIIGIETNLGTSFFFNKDKIHQGFTKENLNEQFMDLNILYKNKIKLFKLKSLFKASLQLQNTIESNIASSDDSLRSGSLNLNLITLLPKISKKHTFGTNFNLAHNKGYKYEYNFRSDALEKIDQNSILLEMGLFHKYNFSKSFSNYFALEIKRMEELHSYSSYVDEEGDFLSIGGLINPKFNLTKKIQFDFKYSYLRTIYREKRASGKYGELISDPTFREDIALKYYLESLITNQVLLGPNLNIKFKNAKINLGYNYLDFKDENNGGADYLSRTVSSEIIFDILKRIDISFSYFKSREEYKNQYVDFSPSSNNLIKDIEGNALTLKYTTKTNIIDSLDFGVQNELLRSNRRINENDSSSYFFKILKKF